MRITPVIAVVNESTVVTDEEVKTAIQDLQTQISYHFRPYWDSWAHLSFFRMPADIPDDMWLLSILDDSDQAGALGYHDVTDTNKPILKVFAKTDQKYGLSWTVTASHEILEALADPWVSAAWQVTNTEFYALEVGDPVEADALGYKVNGRTLVSDFITPAWFVPGLTGVAYDRQRHLTAPLQLADGGYCSIFVSGRGWTQKQMFEGQLRDMVPEADDRRFRDRSRAVST
jgi:hypothetical protein